MCNIKLLRPLFGEIIKLNVKWTTVKVKVENINNVKRFNCMK